MRKILLVLILISFGKVDAEDINESRYGVFANWGLNMHSADFRALPGVPNCCPKFEQGDGLGLSLGALFEMDITTDFFVGVRVGYSDLSGELSSTEPTTIILNNTPQDGEFTHTVIADLQSINANLIGGYKVLPNLNLTGGVGLGSVINAKYEQLEQITTPSDRGTFIDENNMDTGKRTRNESAGDIPDASSLRLFLSVGIGYELPLNNQNTLRLMPEVNYNFALSNVVSSVDWSVSELKAGLALKYVPQDTENFQIIRDTIYVRDTLVVVVAENPRTILEGTNVSQQEQIEGRNKLITTTITQKYINQILDPKTNSADNQWLAGFNERNFNISAKGIDYDGNLTPVATMRVEEFFSDVIHPLLPYVFFEHNSSNIPSRYNLRNNNRNFDINEHSTDGTLEVYYNLLNIVGRRMTDNPNANITLVGTNSGIDEEKDNTELSEKRAEAVKNYLVSSWGIDQNRISTEYRNLPENASNSKVDDGIAENRRVEIYSNNQAILDVITANDTLRKADPPTLRFITSYTGNKDYDSWKIIASQNGKVLKEFGGNGTMPGYVDWNLEKEQSSVPSFESPLDYELVLSKGNESAKTNSQLPLDMIKLSEKIVNKVDDKRIDKYNLILFDFNSSEIKGSNKAIIELIKSRIEENSEVSISGYTDRMGDETLNERLSESRAKSAREALTNTNAISKGFGEKVELYDNNSPEGRMYNRTVEITVETPIK